MKLPIFHFETELGLSREFRSGGENFRKLYLVGVNFSEWNFFTRRLPLKFQCLPFIATHFKRGAKAFELLSPITLDSSG